MPPSTATSDPHDRLSVQALHLAYADKTESFFQGLRGAPGDPCNVQLRTFGTTRTSIARGHDWLNRATLLGDETTARIDEIISYFVAQQQPCFVEWNPGNCYRPNSWNDELGRYLLERGFRPGGFRCVWSVDLQEPEPGAIPAIEVRRFAPDELQDYLLELARIEQQSEEQKAKSRLTVFYGQRDERWHHYVGYVDGAPCCNATLFAGERFACLEWGQTLKQYRGLGCHRALIARRLSDARAAGCSVAYTVTDIGVPSARNLQRAGLRLAYNYVMLKRDAAAD